MLLDGVGFVSFLTFMAQILFFEKPGCLGNARQKLALQAAGHQLVVRSLLAEPWTREALLAFLEVLPVAAWFNRASPRVKRGDVNPDSLAPEPALALLLADPLLIRRPLMRRLDDGSHRVGFAADDIHAWIGLTAAAIDQPSFESCVRSA